MSVNWEKVAEQQMEIILQLKAEIVALKSARAEQWSCERQGGCVCGGDLPRIRQGCGWYVA